MGRKTLLVSYPHLNNCKGDLSKKWYVEYAYRLPGETDKHVFRVYDGLCGGTEQSRRQAADKLIKKYTEYLKSGEYLNVQDSLEPVRETDTHRPEQQRYEEIDRSLRAAPLITRFLKYIRPSVRPNTFKDYKGKLRSFQDYLEKDLRNPDVTKLEKKHLLPFFERLATDKDLCRHTIEKYMQIVRAFYLWLEDIGMRPDDSSPLKRLPKYGRVIDVRPMPFTDDERERLKMAIKPKEPYLWLACEII